LETETCDRPGWTLVRFMGGTGSSHFTNGPLQEPSEKALELLDPRLTKILSKSWSDERRNLRGSDSSNTCGTSRGPVLEVCQPHDSSIDTAILGLTVSVQSSRT